MQAQSDRINYLYDYGDGWEVSIELTQDYYGKECFNGTNSFVLTKGQSRLVILSEKGAVSSVRYEVIPELC